MDFLNQLNPEVLLLPLPKEGGSILYRAFHTFINWVALNVGKAKNAVTSTDVASSRRNE